MTNEPDEIDDVDLAWEALLDLLDQVEDFPVTFDDLARRLPLAEDLEYELRDYTTDPGSLLVGFELTIGASMMTYTPATFLHSIQAGEHWYVVHLGDRDWDMPTSILLRVSDEGRLVEEGMRIMIRSRLESRLPGGGGFPDTLHGLTLDDGPTVVPMIAEWFATDSQDASEAAEFVGDLFEDKPTNAQLAAAYFYAAIQ